MNQTKQIPSIRESGFYVENTDRFLGAVGRELGAWLYSRWTEVAANICKGTSGTSLLQSWVFFKFFAASPSAFDVLQALVRFDGI